MGFRLVFELFEHRRVLWIPMRIAHALHDVQLKMSIIIISG